MREDSEGCLILEVADVTCVRWVPIEEGRRSSLVVVRHHFDLGAGSIVRQIVELSLEVQLGS